MKTWIFGKNTHTEHWSFLVGKTLGEMRQHLSAADIPIPPSIPDTAVFNEDFSFTYNEKMVLEGNLKLSSDWFQFCSIDDIDVVTFMSHFITGSYSVVDKECGRYRLTLEKLPD